MLRIVHRYKTSSFTKLLLEGNAMAVRQMNLQVSATKFCKVKMGIAPDLIKELFPLSAHP